MYSLLLDKHQLKLLFGELAGISPIIGITNGLTYSTRIVIVT
jgi:hypothetical protein